MRSMAAKRCERAIRWPGRLAGMAPEKVDVKRAGDDDKMAMLRELAKMAKPIGEKKEDGKADKADKSAKKR